MSDSEEILDSAPSDLLVDDEEELAADHDAAALAGLGGAAAAADDDEDDDDGWHQPTQSATASPPPGQASPPPGASVPLASPVRQAATAVAHAAEQMERQAADAARAAGGGDEAAEQQQQQPPPPPQEEAAGPSTSTTTTTTTTRPAGLGLGLGSMLPQRRSAAAAASAATTTAATEAPPAPPAPKAPVGLGGLGLKPREASTAAASSAGSGGTGGPSLPPRPAGGVGALPPRPGSQQQQPPRPPAPAPQDEEEDEEEDDEAEQASEEEEQQQQQAAAAPPPPAPPAPAPAARRPALPARGAAALAAGGGGPRLAARPAALGAAASALAPPQQQQQQSFEVVDDAEARDVQRARRRLFDLRVALFRAALRLGVPASADSVANYAAVIDRLERVARPWAPERRRADVGRLAQARAAELERSEPRGAPVGVPRITLLLVGMTGVGKSELINAILDRPAARAAPFAPAGGSGTRALKLVRGTASGLDLLLIDTPGLQASSDARAHNAGVLRAAAGAMKRHKPDFVLYVDRLDAPKAGFGDLSVLQQIGAALGKGVWRQTMVALTHANAARAALGGGAGGAGGAGGDAAYAEALRQRKNVLQNMLRQVSGEAQLRNPIHVVDSHPQSPRMDAAVGRLDEVDEEEEEEDEDEGRRGGGRGRGGQQQQQRRGEPVIFDAPPAPPPATSGPMAGMPPAASSRLIPVPWRRQMLMQLAGLAVYEGAKEACEPPAKERKAAAKAAAQAQAQQQAMAAAMGGAAGGAGGPGGQQKARLPPNKYFLAQLVEHAAAPRVAGTPRDPFAAGKRKRAAAAADFKASYAQAVEAAAAAGDARAMRRREVDAKRALRAQRAFRGAYHNERRGTRAKKKYRGQMASGLGLGPSFDPSQRSQYRYSYPPRPRGSLSVMPTLDYYGWEHEDAITGVVADWKGQPGSVRGWGGVPARLTATLEKDKNTTCVQAEGSATVTHSLPPFGPKHVTQLSGAAELLRPSIKEVLYTGEAATFRDGLLQRGDRAGFGVMAARMAEAGDPRKGPMAVGVKIQETLRVGPLSVDACAAQVRTAGGGAAAAGNPMAAMMGGGGAGGGGGAQGGDEVWGARAFIASDWIPGVALNLDWYRERTRAGDADNMVGGVAAALAYRFALPRRASGKVTVDLVGGGDVAHIDLKLKSARDWRFAWALLMPAASLAKGIWRGLRERADREAEEDEEAALAEEGDEDEDEDDDEDGEGGGGGGDGGMAALQALLGGAGGAGGRIDPAMLQRLMQGGMMRA